MLLAFRTGKFRRSGRGGYNRPSSPVTSPTDMTLWDSIAQQISDASGEPFRLGQRSAIGGGCINSTFQVEDGARRYFVKLNEADRLAMFEAERDGLNEIAASHTVRVPQPLCAGVAAGKSFLAMEYLELGGKGGAEQLGQQLAAMHRVTHERFGWYRDNTIGSTEQPNEETDDWFEFICERRLGHQLDLALKNGYGGRLRRLGEETLDRFPDLFRNYLPPASLLHGDLWGGNFATMTSGEPVIFDPAVYYGDREADIAMTELFGGFPPAFYAAYNEAWPLDPGYPLRKLLYNTYHVLNHLNLFGGGYGAQAEAMMERLLSHLR